MNQAVVAALVSMTANQAGADQGVIEEVVVTATKRAERLRYPVTVDALTSDSLEDFGITNFEDYLFNFRVTAAAVPARIRHTFEELRPPLQILRRQVLRDCAERRSLLG